MDVSLLLNADTASDASPIKEEVNQNWVMVGQVQDVDIDIKHEDPSQHPYSLQGYVHHLVQADSDRRSSTSSLSVSSTASSPRSLKAESSSAHRSACRRINMHCGHLQQPYPTPQSTPGPDGAASGPQHEKLTKLQACRKKRPPRIQKEKKPEKELTPEEKLQRLLKALREGESRDKVTLFLSHLQNALRLCHPDIIEKALGHKQQGWTKLKSNNIRTDIGEAMAIVPLSWNKTNVLRTAVLVLVQKHRIECDMLRHLQALDPGAASEFYTRLQMCAEPSSDLSGLDMFPELLMDEDLQANSD